MILPWKEKLIATGSEYMAKQSNTPKQWRLLAERDLSIAEHLAATYSPLPSTFIIFFSFFLKSPDSTHIVIVIRILGFGGLNTIGEILVPRVIGIALRRRPNVGCCCHT